MSDKNKPSGAYLTPKKMTSGQPQEGLLNSLCFSTSKREGMKYQLVQQLTGFQTASEGEPQ